MPCAVCHAELSGDARFCAVCGAPSPSDWLGRTIGDRYRVVRRIAEGGMGVVWEAEQRMGTRTRRVALKTLLPDSAGDERLVARFRRECGVLAELEHPNKVDIYDFGEADDGALYIAMEFVAGETLADAMARAPLPLDRALAILCQACGALQEAHRRGIVHRDLKPENLVLGTRAGVSDFVKLIDFGIAVRSVRPGSPDPTKLTGAGVVLGTPPYMSPEQLAGREIGPPSDVYSLGVIAYEMLTGILPFDASAPWQWARAHLVDPPRAFDATPAGAALPAGVKKAILRALAKDPAERPVTAGAFFAELEAGARRQAAAPGVPPGEPRTEPAHAPLGVAQSHAEPRAARPAQRTDAGLEIRPAPRGARRGWAAALLAVVVIGAAGALAAVRPWHGDESPLPEPLGAAPPETVIRPELATLPAAAEPPSTVAEPPPRRAAPGASAPPPATAPPASAPPAGSAPPVSQRPPLRLPGAGGGTPRELPKGDAACMEAVSTAQRGGVERAAALHQRCQQTGGGHSALTASRTAIRNAAPGVVKTRAFNGDCPGARAAAAAARSVGVGDAAERQLAQTRCAG